MTARLPATLLLIALLTAPGRAEPPTLRADRPLDTLRAGVEFSVGVYAGDALAPVARPWRLAIGACSTMLGGDAPAPVAAGADGRFRLTVPPIPSLRGCVARWRDGALERAPDWLVFCPHPVTLARCFPIWHRRVCAPPGGPALDEHACDRLARRGGLRAVRPRGPLAIARGGAIEPVGGAAGAGCPVWHAEAGVLFARGGALWRADLRRGEVAVALPADGRRWLDPVIGPGGALHAVGQAADGGFVYRIAVACDGPRCALGVAARMRPVPASVGRLHGWDDEAGAFVAIDGEGRLVELPTEGPALATGLPFRGRCGADLPDGARVFVRGADQSAAEATQRKPIQGSGPR